jgi:hypothetical protein
VRFLRLISLPLAGLAVMAMLSGCGDTATPTGVEPTLDTTPPPAPANLTTSSDANGRAALTWDPSPAADVASYAVYLYSPDPARDNAYILVEDPDPTDNLYQLPLVSENTTAIYRVRAVDTSGNRSAYSSAAEVPLGAQTGGGGARDPIGIE